MKARNGIVELARFLFSVLVVGYHIQMTFSGSVADFFENGALAVEFFFLVSGYFLARSIEKINGKENGKVGVETLRFMKNKVKGILPVHIVAIVAIVIIILACDFSASGKILLNGLPSVFLVQMAALWNHSFDMALIVPEWYLSAMLLCMLIMFPVGLLLRRKLKGVFVPLVLVGILVVIMLAFGLPFGFPQNLIYDVRAWGEMCVGMFAYYLSAVIAKKELKKASAVTLKVVEIVGYGAPIIMGFVPLNANLQPVCMAVTVVGVFAAISVTFAGKGVAITNTKVNAAFGYLGGISLAIYLFHPVIISLLEYVGGGLAVWTVYLIVFAATLASAVIYNSAAALIKIIIKKIKTKAIEGVQNDL